MNTNFDPAGRLRTHFERILGRQCFSPDLVEVLRLTRLLIEQEKWAKQYPTLSLYCNWAQHGEIARHPHAWVILEKINDILVYLGDGDVSAVIREISRAFGLAAFRQEMLLLFMSKSIRTDIVDSLANWKGFLGAVLDDLSQRPLRLPDNIEARGRARSKAAIEAKAVFDRMVSLNRIDAVPRALYITNLSNEVGVPGRPSGFYWNVRLIDQSVNYSELNGILEFTETRADFSRP